MQLINLLALALLPLQILALPSAVAPEQRDVAAVEADETINPEGVSPIPGIYEEGDDHPSKIFARAQVCRVTGSSTVNCRACPSTNCQVTHTVRGGGSCEFPLRMTVPPVETGSRLTRADNWRCTIRGDPVTINGITYTTWYRTNNAGCFVSRHYLPASCSPGSC